MEIEQLLRITNKYGLHARASTRLAQVAQKFDSDITVARESVNGQGEPVRSEPVNAKSVLGILSLGAECGDSVLVRATGGDAEAALEALKDLIEQRFHED